MLLFDNTYYEGGDDKDRLPIQMYQPFGKLAETVRGQGWYPETSPDSSGTITYRSNYKDTFNNVQIPNSKELGHIALVGNKNGMFDVLIRDKNGKTKMEIFKGVSPEQVQQWVMKQGGSIDQRQKRVASETPPIVTNNLPMGSNIF